MRKMESELGIRPLASYGLTEVILRASARTHAYIVSQWVVRASPVLFTQKGIVRYLACMEADGNVTI